jgi:hypothetical protein
VHGAARGQYQARRLVGRRQRLHRRQRRRARRRQRRLGIAAVGVEGAEREHTVAVERREGGRIGDTGDDDAALGEARRQPRRHAATVAEESPALAGERLRRRCGRGRPAQLVAVPRDAGGVERAHGGGIDGAQHHALDGGDDATAVVEDEDVTDDVGARPRLHLGEGPRRRRRPRAYRQAADVHRQAHRALPARRQRRPQRL